MDNHLEIEYFYRDKSYILKVTRCSIDDSKELYRIKQKTKPDILILSYRQKDHMENRDLTVDSFRLLDPRKSLPEEEMFIICATIAQKLNSYYIF